MLKGAIKDKQSVTSEGDSVQELLNGVKVHEVRTQLSNSASTVEVFRRSWDALSVPVDEIIYVGMQRGGINAWYCHERQTDLIFIIRGVVRLVLFDGRESSPTYRRLNIFVRGPMKPSLIVIPPGVWHGIENIAPGESGFLNMFDRGYVYEDPDQWRLPPDTPQIPYRFGVGPVAASSD